MINKESEKEGNNLKKKNGEKIKLFYKIKFNSVLKIEKYGGIIPSY